jgi:hypothetical protein
MTPQQLAAFQAARNLIEAAVVGGRHAALYDGAVILARAQVDAETAMGFLMELAVRIGLRPNSLTRKEIRLGLARGALEVTG